MNVPKRFTKKEKIWKKKNADREPTFGIVCFPAGDAGSGEAKAAPAPRLPPAGGGAAVRQHERQDERPSRPPSRAGAGDGRGARLITFSLKER